MNNKKIILQTAEMIKNKFLTESSGHDWFHIERVWNLAKQIAEKENADLFIVELAALLHDIEDHKLHNGDSTVGAMAAEEWLESLEINDEIIRQVSHIVEHISFKGGQINKINSLEGRVVQDADRMDAIGAIGISRVFMYTGNKNGTLYNPESKEAESIYKNTGKSESAISHFYDKLLKLKDLMNTKTGKEMAEERHKFMEKYLEQFYIEWEGKK